MTETAPERLTRLLALVAFLRDRPEVPVATVAEHFGVTEAQVLADISTLWVSGTPGYMHGDLIDFAGDDLDRGVLTLTDSREMHRPLRLSSGEAVALLVALQSLAATHDDPHGLIAATSETLRTAAGQAAAAADAVRIGGAATDTHVADIRRALAEGRRLRLRYVSAADVTTEREVDPLELLTDSSRWFLHAWCYRADGERQFRLDRILALEVLGTRIQRHRAAAGVPATVETAAGTPVTIELASRARWAVETLPGVRTKELADGWVSATVGVVDPAWLANLILGLGDQVRAVRPLGVQHSLRDRAQAALDAYGRWDADANDGPGSDAE